MGLRDFYLAMAPPWLQDPQKTGGKFVGTMGVVSDLLLEKAEQALLSRMPGALNPGTLPFIGADRLIPRGPGETEREYAARLRQAFDIWQLAGISEGVLRQVLGFLEAFKPRGRVVTDSSRWISYAPGADLTQHAAYQNGGINWNWDNEGDPHPTAGPAWWRWWLVLYSTTASGNNWAGTRAKWGAVGRKWGDLDKAWGVGIPSDVFRSIRAMVGLSKRAGSWLRWFVISFDDGLFEPTAAGDDVINPAGGWKRFGHVVNNVYVAARPTNASYADGWASTGATLQANWPNY